MSQTASSQLPMLTSGVEGEGEGEGIQGGDQGEKKVGEGNQISPEQKNTQTNEEENGGTE